MKKLVNNIFLPFGNIDKKTYIGIALFWGLFLFLFFEVFRSPIIPAPSKIGGALIDQITSADFWDDFIQSFALTMKAMFKSIIITMFIVYAATIPMFRPFAELVTKFRYLTITGLIFLFTMITANVSELKMNLLLFGITPFFVTSFLSVVMGIPQIEIDKAYVNKKNRWETLYEVVIVGKLDQLIEVMRQNFAISWMMITTVEAYDMAGGGLGTLLLKKSRVVDLAPIFSTLILVLITGLIIDYLLSLARRSFFPYIEKKK